ncbi:alpha/beta hydrolase [Flammeovirga agarivorans]|uniref:Alpha/beta hydrolase n=1 Tax=Flammeovirga agarivorans TaxID=2726742 RepID=A0A7X8XUZ7_9BACT|nr:alpha/beta hydrolase [Flammeovirga agarivorans]NLR90826.1 alpha/beta hydrolase [Flammeovirga agarivorans]
MIPLSSRNKKIIGGVSLSIILIYIVVSFFSYNQSVLIKTYQGESHLEEEKQNGSFDTTLLAEVNREDFTVDSDYGYQLKGSYLKVSNEQFPLTVIMVHGVTHDRWRMMRYAQIYLKNGIDVVLYDHRKHGLSGGNEVSFSYFESRDLEKIVQWTKQKKPSDIIAAHGESLGAATVCSHSGINETTHSVNFYISDCAFSDTKNLLVLRAKEDFGMPNIGFVDTTSLLAKIRAGFYFADASPIKGIRQSKVPVLFIHGKADTYIPMEMSQELYDAKSQGAKFIWFVDKAEHARSITTAPVEYEKKVMNYIHTMMTQLLSKQNLPI